MRATPPAAAEAIHRQIAGSTLVVMPAVAHMLCAEDPAAFHKHVLGFLDKQAASGMSSHEAAIAALLGSAGRTAIAQHHKQHRNQTPYAGLQQRAIKALSDGQIADLRTGRGMGLALAAELNGYPGPLHVLELKDQLQLTADQKQRFQHLYDSMKAEASRQARR